MKRLLNLGITETTSPVDRRYLRFINAALLIALVGTVVSVPLSAVFSFFNSTWTTLAVLSTLTVVVLWLHKRQLILAGRLTLQVGMLLYVTFVAVQMDDPSSMKVYYFLIAAVGVLSHSSRAWRMGFSVVSFLLYAWLDMGMPGLRPEGRFNANVAVNVGIFSVIVLAYGVFYGVETRKMLGNLHRLNAEATETNEALTRLNAELRTAVDTSERRAEALNVASSTRERILSVLGHDLRGPLASLDGVLAMYEQSGDNRAVAEELLPLVRQHLTVTREQLDDVMTWARTVLGRDDPDATSDLSNVVNRALGQVVPRAHVKEVAVEAAVPPRLVARLSSPALLLVLRNLLGNAVKFTDAGGAVRVEAFVSNDDVKLRVADTGVGMSAERLETVRAGAPRTVLPGTAGETGSGLGLALCREVVDHYGGTFDVDSAPGEGTVVTVCFPDRALTPTLPPPPRAALVPA